MRGSPPQQRQGQQQIPFGDDNKKNNQQPRFYETELAASSCRLSFMTRHLAAPPALRNSVRVTSMMSKPRVSSWWRRSVLMLFRMIVRSTLMALQAKQTASDSLTMIRFSAG